MGNRGSFPGGKAAGTWSWPLTSIYCRDQECVVLFLHTPNSPWNCGSQLKNSTGSSVRMSVNEQNVNGIWVRSLYWLLCWLSTMPGRRIEGVEVYLHTFFDLCNGWRWVVSFTLRPLYPQGKRPWHPLDGGLGGPQSRSGRGGEEKTSQPLPGLELPTIQPVAQCSYYIMSRYRHICNKHGQLNQQNYCLRVGRPEFDLQSYYSLRADRL
jgi:hypothetical protein